MHQQFWPNLPAEKGAAGPSKRNYAPIERKARTANQTKALVIDDPPDHMEERARRVQKNVVSRQRSTSTLSTSSSTSASRNVASLDYSPQTQKLPCQQLQSMTNRKKRAESTKSMPTAGSSPMSKTPPLSNSYHSLLPRTKEESSESTDNAEQSFHPRSRRQSPHPADILKGKTAAAAELKKKHRPPASGDMTDEAIDGIHTFTISHNLESSESAEELSQLIEAMQHEFQRLRSSKLQAEAKASKLQTDISTQQQEMEKHFESLSIQNEHLKRDANKSKIKLGQLTGEVDQLERDKRVLGEEKSELQKAKEVLEARAIAAELRAATAEEENAMMQKKLVLLMEKGAHSARRRDVTSPLNRNKGSSAPVSR